jgi:hypothetical protein
LIESRKHFLEAHKHQLDELELQFQQSALLTLQVTKLFELHFHIPSAVLFFFSGLKIIVHRKYDNNFESSCILKGSHKQATNCDYLCWWTNYYQQK